jgi:acetylornithine/succinyldiaminopimelate/putrescine aminotransferase
MSESFLNKFRLAFGKKEALMLQLAGLNQGEIKGRGSWVYTGDGEKWLDFGSFGIHLLGHSHPRVVNAAIRQLEQMGLSTKILGNQQATQCAASLLGTLPESMNRVTFANSGAESTEIAIKTAALFTSRSEFIALTGSFHGKTTGAYRLTDHGADPTGYQLPGYPVHFVEPGDSETLGRIFRTAPIAALILEPLQGEGGIRPVPADFIRECAALCRAHGALFIIDEIQTGLGRCGKLWCAVSGEMCPDLLLVGKTLGGGIVPISAVVFHERVNTARCSDPLLNASSFAGGAFACAIAQQVIEMVSQPEFLAEVREKGEFCKAHLSEQLKENPLVKEIRGQGLMLGIEFLSSPLTAQVITEALKQRLLLSFCLVRSQVMRFYPPAVTSYPDLKQGLEILGQIINQLTREEISPKE